MMTAVQAMFSELRDSMINNNNTMNNNISSLRAEINSNSDATRELGQYCLVELAQELGHER
jgi:hypothetical protein